MILTNSSELFEANFKVGVFMPGENVSEQIIAEKVPLEDLLASLEDDLAEVADSQELQSVFFEMIVHRLEFDARNSTGDTFKNVITAMKRILLAMKGFEFDGKEGQIKHTEKLIASYGEIKMSDAEDSAIRQFVSRQTKATVAKSKVDDQKSCEVLIANVTSGRNVLRSLNTAEERTITLTDTRRNNSAVVGYYYTKG